MYKTIYDGTIFAESEEAGIGVIIRDIKGLVIAALEHSQQWRYIAILLKFSSTYSKDTLQQWRYKVKI